MIMAYSLPRQDIIPGIDQHPFRLLRELEGDIRQAARPRHADASDQDNPPCVQAPTNDLRNTAARSRHPGGVNVTQCDGSVKFMKNSISFYTWQALSTTQGGEVISSDSY